VIVGDQVTQRYGRGTGPTTRTVPAALLARAPEDVVAAVRVARDSRVPIYPISRGHNWGYGDATPVIDGCVILDLSGMDRIIDLDRELGLVTLQPGVSQAQLRAHLDAHAPELMVPTTGAGPDASLVGNVCERGYGITPHQDHFMATTAIEAVLPDGSLYRSPLSELGAITADRAHKWGLGPYLDGLFTQGNIGVVTQMTIALARRGERPTSFYFSLRDDDRLEETVAAVQELIRAGGGALSGINLMNAHRVLAMSVPYPNDRVGRGEMMSPQLTAAVARQAGVDAWAMKVIGLAPAAARIDLESCELPVLVDELLERVHAQSGSLLEEHKRHTHAITGARLQEASDWLLEYRNLLAAVADDRDRKPGAPVSIVAPMEVALSVIVACCREAHARLGELLDRASNRDELGRGAEALRAWIDTLSDVRYLDEQAPESTAL
jgi:FAD/FMN-containing dehydrogenase